MNTFSNPRQVHPPLGAYSHAVKVPPDATWLALAGQVGVTPKGNIQKGMQRQAEQAFRNILAGLRANGMGKEDLVKLVVYVTDSQPDRGVPRSAHQDHRRRRAPGLDAHRHRRSRTSRHAGRSGGLGREGVNGRR